MDKVTLFQLSVDISLGLGLLWVAWQALTSKDMFRGIVLFIAFGLLMALTWVRLDAPDVALAEAAIGAGLTGALLMSALARLRDTGGQAENETNLQDHNHTELTDEKNNEFSSTGEKPNSQES